MADVRSKLSSDQKVARVRESYKAVERGDFEKGAEGLANDVVFHSQLRQRDFKGRDTVLAEQLKQRNEFKAEYKLHDVTGSDTHVVALMEVSQEVDGERQTGRLVHILHVDDEGKAREIWTLFSPLS
jgi:ketosteroid isomerase-like protein